MSSAERPNPSVRRIVIPALSARAFSVAKGETIRITDTDGGQPGDLVAFNANDLSERFGQCRTRVENRSFIATTGHHLWSNGQPPKIMFTIVEDTSGGHDLLYAPCCRYALEKRFHVVRDGCLENLARALAPWGITMRDVPDPLNLFFVVRAGEDGRLTVQPGRSKPGDCITLRAEMDCLVAIAACAVPRESGRNSGYVVEITG